MTNQLLNPGDSATIGKHRLSVWPEGQQIQKWFDTDVLVTEFNDHAAYSAELSSLILKRAADPQLSQKYKRDLGIGSAKVYDLHKWPGPVSALIHARAVAFFRRSFSGRPAVVDLSWASVYRNGDFCMPHSHPRTLASILYVLDLGDSDKGADGRFFFADPRLSPCCREESGYMSTPCAPILKPGVMMMFPGQVVHLVNPYWGKKRPRLTLTWNLNHAAKPGSPLPKGVRRPD